MARTTRKSIVRNIIVCLAVALTAFVLALQFVAAPAFNVPSAGNKAETDTMNGVKVNYTDAPDWMSDYYDYRLTDETVKTESANERTPKPDEQVSVIITLTGTPMMQYASSRGMSVGEAMATHEGLKNYDSLSDIRRFALNDISEYLIETRYDFFTIANAVSATVKYKNVAEIQKSKFVKNVILSNTYLAPQTVTENFVEVYESGIFDTSGIGYDGTGTVVAVLDTGTDFTHEVFDMELDAEKVAMTKDDVAAMAPYLTATRLSAEKGDSIDEDDLYIKTKLPFSYDYADGDSNVYPHEAHGTHVAGIIAGKSDVITGVAPGAQIATFKVFSDYRSGAQTEWILAALEDAVKLNVDAINMSLGTSCGFSREVDEKAINDIYDAINDAGICLIVAASNDASSANGSTWGNTNLTSNPDSGTVGSPASYNASLAVASVSGVKTKYFMYEGKEKYFAESRLVGKTDPNDFVAELLGDKQEGEFEYVVVPGTGISSNYSNIDVNGKIAVVRRGVSNFEEKVNVAADKGAIAVIVYNNVSGTISMSVGTKYRIPSCFITMDLSEDFVAAGAGKISFSKSYLAGPFMSDFSSWGALPDLTLAPDITGHGGEIYSAVPGGDMYDRFSGTSMASPNMAGAVILVRQYVKEKYPEYTTNQIRDESYSRMMSTATIVRNEDGNPYSPRKQGSGLANIAGSIETSAFLTVDGSNKPKLSLGDDPARSGVYKMEFNLVNTSGNAVSYNLNPYVMTESLSSDGITVAEKAYLFNDTTNVYSVNATKGNAVLNGNTVSLSGYGEAKITAEIALSVSDKEYLDTNFRNGMFVEGYIVLESNNLDGITLSIPYMAFYGNWADAPMLDKTAYEVGESEADESVLEEDKVKADQYGTLPYSGFASSTAEDGIAYYGMGEFAYIPATGYESTPPQEKYAALTTNPDGDYLFYGVSMGLLRGAHRVDMEIRDSVTGELIWSGVDYNVRKAHASGGQQVGGLAMIELDIRKLNLPNNMKCTFTMKCYLDWKDGNGEYTYGNNNTFSFDFTIDNEAPELHDAAVRKEKNGTSYRYYLDISLYDNHYIQGYALSTFKLAESGFNADGSIKNNLQNADIVSSKSITNGMVPANGNFNTNSTFSFNVTSYWSTILANDGVILVNAIDYAKNQNVFWVRVHEETDLQIAKTRTASDTYSVPTNGQIDLLDYITVKANTVDDVAEEDKAYVEGYWAKDLVWASSDPSVVEVNNGLITGLKEGTATITVHTPNVDKYDEADTNHCLKFTVSVTSEQVELTYTGIELSSEALVLERGEEAVITAKVKPYNYTGDITLDWSSTSPNNVKILSVSEDGMSATIRAMESGSAQIRATVKGSRISGYCSVRVSQEFNMTNNIYLRSYTGRGDENGVVEIPDDLGIVYIYPQAFAGNEYIKKVIIPEGVTTIMRGAFVNCSALEEVVLPDTLETIEKTAFANDNALKYINLGHVKSIGEGAFWGAAMESIDLASCTYLDAMSFFRCESLKSVDLSRVGIVGGGAFAMCTSLENLTIPKNVSMAYTEYENGAGNVMYMGSFSYSGVKSVTIYSDNVGEMAFYGCENLKDVTFMNDVEIIDDRAFLGCKSLTNVTYNKTVYKIGNAAFSQTSLTEIRIPDGLAILGQQAYFGCLRASKVYVSSGALLTELNVNAFYGTLVSEYVVENGNKYMSSAEGVLFDRAQRRLIAYPWCSSAKEYTVPETVQTIGASAFATPPSLKVTSNSNETTIVAALNSISIGSVKYIEAGAFRGSNVTTVTDYDNLEYIGDYAFGYSALTNLPIGAKTKHIGDSAFINCGFTGDAINLSIPKNIEYLGSYAFAHTPVVSVTFKNSSLKTVGEAAFAGCTELSNVDLGKLEKLGDGMFGSVTFTGSDAQGNPTNTTYSCTSLVNIVIPDTVTDMGSATFEKSKLASIELSASLKKIGNYAFMQTELTSVNLPSSVESVGNYAFAQTPIGSIDLKEVKTLGSYAFAQTPIATIASDKLIEIGDYAFSGCLQLVSAEFPAAVTVGSGAFIACPKLEIVDLRSAETIGSYAFAVGYLKDGDAQKEIACESLETIVLDSAKILGESAFSGATALKSVSLGAVEFIGANAFKGTIITSLELPATLSYVADGAFMGANELTAVNVAQNNVSYRSDDGVLYAIVENDFLVLVGYPAGKTDEAYSVLDRTVKLGAQSFNANKHLCDLTLSAYVQVIGHAALNGSTGIKNITFYSPDAPVLESEGKVTYGIFNSAEYVNTYANFGFTLKDADKEDYELTISIPSNNSGYDNRIWKQYVGKYITVSDSIHAAFSTLDFIERVKALPSNPTSADANEINMLARLYNLLNAAQRQFVLGTYNYTDADGNTIDSQYYTTLLGGKNYYTMLTAAQSKLPTTSASNANGEEVAYVTAMGNFIGAMKVMMIIGAVLLAVVIFGGVAIAIVNKRRNRR